MGALVALGHGFVAMTPDVHPTGSRLMRAAELLEQAPGEVAAWLRWKCVDYHLCRFKRPAALADRASATTRCPPRAAVRGIPLLAGTSSSRRSPAAVLLCDRETSQRQLSASVANGWSEPGREVANDRFAEAALT
jgi:hypothetical protein